MLQQRTRSSATAPTGTSPDDPPGPTTGTSTGTATGTDPGPGDGPGDGTTSDGASPGTGATRRERLARRLRGPRPRRRALVVGAVAVVLVAALVVYLTVLRPRASSAQEAGAAQPVTAQATTATFEQTVTTTGTLTPSVQEDVSFAAAGTVQTVEVAAGDTVEAGQTLATIDTLQLDAALAQANADLAQAQADLADAQESDDGSDAAGAAVEARESAVAVAQQAYDDAAAAMADATLTAPAAGLVTSVGVAVGDTVGSSSGSSGATGSGSQGGTGTAPGGSTGTAGTGSSSGASSSASGTAAFTIVGTDAWTVDVSVGEADVAAIETGDQVEMTSDDLADTVFGTVSEIGRLPSTTQGAVAYPVSVVVTGSPEGLYDGVSVDVSIVTERRTDVLSVHAAAVSTNDDGASVVTLVADDGSTSEQVVETGETSGQSVEIVSGLAEGDTVQYTAFTPGAGRGQVGEQGGTGGQGFPEGFDPSQLPRGGQGGGQGFPEGFDPSQLGARPGQGGNS
ncbi:macrolide-specific efflux system membrane fusion protein [Cellulosimicrobium cellulans]|uniref:efflux RND transporter periplasmic adaptor subunit n=1 Tax=Cellulosimicrobium cellulans TaxID=1710 RepID=UPI0027DBDD21|nr:biotin/lipoyl-binding protein [Cellulosimicrobium cellulans]MBM7818375.1 macrolide-specific efflux system membrane fusion protein [Cellulosimicrobium cellulans]